MNVKMNSEDEKKVNQKYPDTTNPQETDNIKTLSTHLLIKELL